MLEVFLDSLKDSAIIFGIVFVTYFILSFLEKFISKKMRLSSKWSPLIGASLGLIPQCGVSVLAGDFFLARKITIGTLIAVFLSCSDEALPILFSDSNKWYMGFVLIGLKIIIGFSVGLMIDLIYRRKEQQLDENKTIDKETTNHVGCCHHNIEEENLWHLHLLHPLIHSLKIFVYVFIVTFLFGTLMFYVGQDNIFNFLSNSKYYSPLFAILIGLIPNCASSVLLSELYVLNALSFGALLGGLLVNAGLGLFIIMKDKKRIKTTLVIIAILIGTGLIASYTTCLINGF